ncbi:MAG: hypothetical protein CVV24_00865 [Ignavibacteriae bacterium HGW-Ignavibacteriae-3]|nr:MAG: hypothetical protein CVV24_00865 [Ignavibacteriae bacterium HGW-Ignavibacteriae-3]
MKFKWYSAYAIIFVFLYSSSSLYPQNKIDDKTSLNYLRNNLKVLASDEYEGRETATRGEKLASLFISSELGKYDVKPFGDNGTYFQNFDLLSSGYSEDAKIALLDKSNSLIGEFLLGDDFIRSGRGFADISFASQTTGIVFAGYGMTQKENNHDDYANIDVNGKTVLILSGEPYRDKNNPAAQVPFLASSTDSKIKLAKENGAIGVLIIVDERLKSFWSRIKEFGTQPSIGFVPKEPQEAIKNIPVFTVGEKFVEQILAGEKYSYEKLNEMLKAKESPAAFQLNKKLKFDIRPFLNTVQARNVVGLIEGTDPKLKDEFVVLSAHYDHIGTRRGIVNNGADDDGSGTVAVLEAARRLSSENNNKRSIIFLFNTGEEKGLLGSGYATDNWTFMENVVANINLDMVGRESADSLHCIGSGKLSTEFANLIQEANSGGVDFVLNYKYDDPKDPNRFYYRSDHYNFARKGIPIVFFFDDMTVDYHKSTDDVEKINFEKILKVVKLTSDITLGVANLDHKLIVDKKNEDVLPRQRRD